MTQRERQQQGLSPSGRKWYPVGYSLVTSSKRSSNTITGSSTTPRSSKYSGVRSSQMGYK